MRVLDLALEQFKRDFSKKATVFNYPPKPIPNLTHSGKADINIIEFAGGHTIEIPKSRLVQSMLSPKKAKKKDSDDSSDDY